MEIHQGRSLKTSKKKQSVMSHILHLRYEITTVRGSSLLSSLCVNQIRHCHFTAFQYTVFGYLPSQSFVCDDTLYSPMHIVYFYIRLYSFYGPCAVADPGFS